MSQILFSLVNACSSVIVQSCCLWHCTSMQTQQRALVCTGMEEWHEGTGHSCLGAVLVPGFGQQGKGSHSGAAWAFPSTDLPSCPQKLRGHLRCGECVRLPMQGLSKETMTIQVSEKPEQNIRFFPNESHLSAWKYRSDVEQNISS